MQNKVLLTLLGVTTLVVIIALVVGGKDAEAPVAPTGEVPTTESSSTTDLVVTESGEATSATNQPTPSGTGQAATPAKPTVAAPQSSAVVLPQLESASIVTVATARLAKPGYIVIYRTNSQNVTELIGYSKVLPAGYYTNVAVQVRSGVVRKQVVMAVVHEDDGDEVFEFPISDSYLKSGGRIVYDEDVVDVPLAEEAGLINGTIESRLEDAKSRYTGD